MFTYAELTIIGRSLEDRANTYDRHADKLYQERSSDDSPEVNKNRTINAESYRSNASVFRQLADKVWIERRKLG